MKRNVLFIDNYKLYYNSNINMSYNTSPILYEINNLESLFNSEFKNSIYKNKIWVNNGNQAKLIIQREADKIIGTKNWRYGKLVNNSKQEFRKTNNIKENSYQIQIPIFKNNQYIFISRVS